MQLRFTPPLSVRTTGVGFKQGLSATLTGVTTIGAFTVVTFNSDKARTSIADSFEPIKQLLGDSVFLNGINQLSETLSGWGSSIVASKDAFKEWLNNYLGPDGLKSGVSELYSKLYRWATIVYEWFRDKFIPFLKNIPSIVENWKQIRLSLFKWGTFIGVGGGGALWGMFGSFDNWGKLADLMGNEDFTGAVEKFAELVDQNPKAFEDIDAEERKEIFQKMMDDPKDAKEIAEELLQEQKDQNKDKAEGEKQEELEAQKIKESYAGAKGSPKSQEEVFGYFVGNALQNLMKMPSAFDSSIEATKKKAKGFMEEYMKTVEAESKKKTKAGEANLKFLEALGEDEKQKEEFVTKLAEVATAAFNEGHNKFTDLAKAFERILRDKFTVPMEEGGDESQAVVLENMVREPKQKKRK